MNYLLINWPIPKLTFNQYYRFILTFNILGKHINFFFAPYKLNYF